MKPVYLEIANPHRFTPGEFEVMVKFAGQPVNVLELMKTGIPFYFCNLREGQDSDFVVIDSLDVIE
jgi:hypothetical protein